MSSVKELRDGEFDAEVLKSRLPVLVDFFATWCGPCKALSPVLEGIAKAYDGGLKVVKVNVDDSHKLAASYGIRAVPTLVLFKDGKAIDTMEGVPSANALRQKLDAAVGFEQVESCSGGCGGCSCG
ncbi:MAG: thioredoxin [bacterium]